MNNQPNQIKKSTDTCYHCQEKKEIIFIYSHTFYQKLNNPTMETEIIKFCWKCVPLLDKNYYLNYGFTISEGLLTKTQESWGSFINAESKAIMVFKAETETAEEKTKELGKKVGKIITEIGKKIPLKCLTCNFNSNILVINRQKCQNSPRCFSVNSKSNKTDFCDEHKELKCENKDCDYQEWLEKKINLAEPIVKKYGFVRENNLFSLSLRKVN